MSENEKNRKKVLDAFILRKDVEYFAELVDITKLNVEIKKIVARQNELRTSIDTIVRDIEGK